MVAEGKTHPLNPFYKSLFFSYSILFFKFLRMTQPLSQVTHPPVYTDLRNMNAQKLLIRVRADVSFAWTEKLRYDCIPIVEFLAYGMLGCINHLYLALSKPCRIYLLPTPPDTYPLEELTATCLDTRTELDTEVKEKVKSLAQKAKAISTQFCLNHLRFYIDCNTNSRRFDPTFPKIILPLSWIKTLTEAELHYLIARRICQFKVGFGFRRPLYHTLMHWNFVAINGGIAALTLKDFLSPCQAALVVFLVNSLGTTACNWLQRRKMRAAEWQALKIFGTNQGMLDHLTYKLRTNYFRKHQTYPENQAVFEGISEKTYKETKASVDSFWNKKYSFFKDSLTDRLELVLRFSPTTQT